MRAACAVLYAPYVTDTVVTFETEPPTAEQMAERIAAARRRHAWLVLEDDGDVGRLRLRRPVQGARRLPLVVRGRACTSSQDDGATGGGRPRTRPSSRGWPSGGFRTARRRHDAARTRASEGLHARLGFEPVGVYRRIGWKHGAWHDVAWMQRTLASTDGPTGGAAVTERR